MEGKDDVYCLLMLDTKTGETTAMRYGSRHDALNAMRDGADAWSRARDGVKPKIPDGCGEVCVNGRIWRIISLNEESRRVAASGIPYCGHKLTMYVPQCSEKTGRMMYHNIGEYIKGEVCYIPECAFTYEFYSKSNPGTRGEYAVIGREMAEGFGYTQKSIQSMCEFAIRMYYPVLSKRGVRPEAGFYVFLQLGGESVDEFIRDAPADFIESLVMPARDSNNIHN